MRLFPMNAGQMRARLAQAGAVVAAVALDAGCGSAYRPVVTPINSSGPAAQAQSYVVVVSAPSPTTPGIVTIIDYSGDTVLVEAPVGPGPIAFTIDAFAANGYTVNSDGTLTNFPISSTLQAKEVTYSTLSSAAQSAPPHPPVNLFSPSGGLWTADLGGSFADVFAGSPQAFKVAIPVAATPVTIIGPASAGQYNYARSISPPEAGRTRTWVRASSGTRRGTAVTTLCRWTRAGVLRRAWNSGQITHGRRIST